VFPVRYELGFYIQEYCIIVQFYLFGLPFPYPNLHDYFQFSSNVNKFLLANSINIWFRLNVQANTLLNHFHATLYSPRWLQYVTLTLRVARPTDTENHSTLHIELSYNEPRFNYASTLRLAPGR
jgi:hypothetical protein